MFSATRLIDTLPVAVMAFGASLVTHGVLGYADAQRVAFQSATGATLRTVPATRLVWKSAIMTAGVTLLAAYGHQYLNETYGAHVIVPPSPPRNRRSTE